MHCVVNDDYQYIMFYSAKAGCTSMRTLYLAVHAHEMKDEELAQLKNYHNLNEVFAYDPTKDYRNYFKYYISRNPYGRVVSAFLDQYTFAQNSGVQAMFEKAPPVNGMPQTFLEFLEYLKGVPDADRDSHFQTQSYFVCADRVLTRRPVYRRLRPGEILLNYVGDISGFNTHLKKVFKRIFKKSTQMKKLAIAEISKVKKMNSSFYGDTTYRNAATLSIEELDSLVFAPKPQDFFIDKRAQTLVEEIYAEDFIQFSYDPKKIPVKSASPEIAAVPDDFDWQTYLLLSPDLPPNGINNERTVTRHYLEFGRHETNSRFYKIKAPQGFDWQTYLQLNPDLTAAGIDNERDAIIHYLSFGIHEKRAIQ